MAMQTARLTFCFDFFMVSCRYCIMSCEASCDTLSLDSDWDWAIGAWVAFFGAISC